MDAIDVGCSILRSRFLEAAMGALGYFGHGAVGSVIGLVFIAYGYGFDNPKMKKAGLAVILSIIVAGILANLLKLGLQLPRPRAAGSYGFPSGHASTAFSLASSLGVAFPGWTPFFYLLASLTAISRLYFRAHFVSDILGGSLIGIFLAWLITKRLVPPTAKVHRTRTPYLAWVPTAAVVVIGMAFFVAFERSTQRHRLARADSSHLSPAPLTVDFGTLEARPSLRDGWSVDENWMPGSRSVVWAEGATSELKVSFPSTQDYRVRIHLLPFQPGGPSCQRVEVKVNHVPVARLHLEKGWNWYEFTVPTAIIKEHTNSIGFYYTYAESPKSLGLSDDGRALSVAFDLMEVFPER